MLANHKIFLIGGFCITQFLALMDQSGTAPYFGGNNGAYATGIPFWPIWWAHTARQEGNSLRASIFVATLALAALEFGLELRLKYRNWEINIHTFCMGIALGCMWAIMAITNTNPSGWGWLILSIHYTAEVLANILGVLYLCALRGWCEWHDIIVMFVFLSAVEQLQLICLLDPTKFALITTTGIDLLRLSSLAQWIKLFFFVAFS